MFNSKLLTLAIISNLLFSLTDASACPGKNGVPDFNCDGKIQIAVIGDSLVSGIGDTANNNKGGYVLRAQQKLKDIKLINLGVPGLNTRQLLGDITPILTKGANTQYKEALDNADVVFLDVGRNDRWFFDAPAGTLRNLKRIASLIKKHAKNEFGDSPLVVTAVLMLPNRGSQGPWVKELDALILKANTLSAPSDLRFDLANKRLLNEDQIHPSAAGYKQLSEIFVKYLTKSLPKIANKLLPDEDKDKIYDKFEKSKFGTSAELIDSDGDGKSDFQEIFTLNTNALAVD